MNPTLVYTFFVVSSPRWMLFRIPRSSRFQGNSNKTGCYLQRRPWIDIAPFVPLGTGLNVVINLEEVRGLRYKHFLADFCPRLAMYTNVTYSRTFMSQLQLANPPFLLSRCPKLCLTMSIRLAMLPITLKSVPRISSQGGSNLGGERISETTGQRGYHSQSQERRMKVWCN